MIKAIFNSSAFTLLEILIAVMIFGIIMLTVFSAFSSFIVSSEMVKENMIASEIESSITKIMVRDFLSLRIAIPPEYLKGDSSLLESSYSASGYGDSRSIHSSSINGADKDKFRFSGDEIINGANAFSWVRFASLAHISFGSHISSASGSHISSASGSHISSASGSHIPSGVAQIIYYVRSNYVRFNNEHTFNGKESFDLCRSDTLNKFNNTDNRFDGTENSECDPILCKNITQFKITYIDIEGEEHSYWDSESDEFGYATPVSIAINMEFKTGDSLHKFSTRISLPLFRPPVK